MAKTYAEKLKDPRWQKMRLQVMERDKFTCRDCRSQTETLNVHHSHYRKGAEPWDYEDRFLITLCQVCHETAESRREVILKATTRPEVQESILAFSVLMANGDTPFSPAYGNLLSEVWAMMKAARTIDSDSEDAECAMMDLKAAALELQRWLWMAIEHSERKLNPDPQF